MTNKVDSTGKVLEMNSRQKKILHNVIRGVRHDDIAKKLRISHATFYRDLKAIKKFCGLIPEEIIAKMALEMVRQLSIKLEITFDDMMMAHKDWRDFKTSIEKKRNKADQKKWSSLTLAEQQDIMEQQSKKQWGLYGGYVEGQKAHSFALQDIIRFKKAIGVYGPDLTGANINLDNSTTTNIENLMVSTPEEIYAEMEEDYGADFAAELKEKIEGNKYIDAEYEEIIVDDGKEKKKKEKKKPKLLKGKKELEKEVKEKKKKSGGEKK